MEPRFSVFLFLLGTVSVRSVPLRMSEPWTILLCRFKDQSFVLRNASWFEQWFNNEYLDGSIAQYFRDVSNGIYQLHAAKMIGWFSIAASVSEVHRMVIEEGGAQDLERLMALRTKDLCLQHAIRHYDLSLTSRVVTFVDALRTAIFCPIRGVLISPEFFMSSALAHEIAHSFHIGHSFSDRMVKVYPHGEPGEYDDLFDLMSTGNAYSYRTAFGPSGPGFNGPHLDYLGWLPANRVLFFNTAIHNRSTFYLSSLSIPHYVTRDLLLILIPYDRDDPQKVFTVELRTPQRYDRGLPASGILVHQVENRKQFYFSKLISAQRSRLGSKTFTRWLLISPAMRNAFVLIETIYLGASEAVVKITSNFTPTACALDELPRLVSGKKDRVCVSYRDKKVAEKVWMEQSKRVQSDSKCLPGYTRYKLAWKQPLCLQEEEYKTLVEQDGRWERYQRFYKTPTYGLNMCKSGYVWRGIDDYDYVCVTAQRKSEVAEENKVAKNNTDRSGSCKDGYVYRNAFPGDLVCVETWQKVKAHDENSLNEIRLRYFRFFNGIDQMAPDVNHVLTRAYQAKLQLNHFRRSGLIG